MEFANGGVISTVAYFPTAMCFRCKRALDDIRYEPGEVWFCKSCAPTGDEIVQAQAEAKRTAN